MIQSNYLCVILRVKRKNILILTVFTWFLVLDKIQDGGQDGDHAFSSATTHKIYFVLQTLSAE